MSDVAVGPILEAGPARFETDLADGSGRVRRPDAGSTADPRSARYLPLMPLLAEFAGCAVATGRQRELRDELARGFTPVVRHLSRRYYGRGEPMADLEQVGMIGLLGAIDRFAPPPGCRLLDAFLAFAVPTITGEIRRYFRDCTWAIRVPRRLKDQQVRVHGAVESLSAELGRAPRPSEIAARLGCAVAELLEALEAQNAYRTSSLDESVDVGGTRLLDCLGQLEPIFDRIEHRKALRNAIAGLPERERTILLLRFFGDLTQTQIGARVGLSQMHVSRLLHRSLSTIREQMRAS